jgi:nitrogen fixation protein NifB
VPLTQKCAAVDNNLIPFHPCLHPEAHHKVPRLHLAVAPQCNTRCGYCEREVSRRTGSINAPGLASSILSPEQAVAKVREFVNRWGMNAVVGVAGPGEPLANEETLLTLRLVRQEFPDLALCLCTNGLNLPDYCRELRATGVQHLTVTINGLEPSVVAQIQPTVTKNGRVYEGEHGAKLLIENQLYGLKLAVEMGMVVKVNTVLIPEINGGQIVGIARAVKDLGARVFNPMPLIPRGAFRNIKRPESMLLSRLRSKCSEFIPVFHHCKQCRADAEGIPGKEEAR